MTDAEVAAKYGLAVKGVPVTKPVQTPTPVPEARAPQSVVAAPISDAQRAQDLAIAVKYGLAPKGAVAAPSRSPQDEASSRKSFMEQLRHNFGADVPEKDRNMLTDAKTLLTGLGYVPGLINAGIGEAANRFKTRNAPEGTSGLGKENWISALAGAGPSSLADVAEKNTDIPAGPRISDMGLVDPGSPWDFTTRGTVATVADLFTGGALKKAAKLPGLITKGGASLGKSIYRIPWAAADAKVANTFHSSNIRNPTHGFSDVLWNDGKPIVGGFSQSNEKMVKAIDASTKTVWERMLEKIKTGADHDLAPDITSQKVAAGLEAGTEAVDDKIAKLTNYIMQRKRTTTSFDKLQPAQQAAYLASEKKLKAMVRGRITDKVGDEGSNLAVRMDTLKKASGAAGEDAFINNTKEKYLARLTAGDNSRTAAAKELKEAMPEFAGLIEENLGKFKTSEQDEALTFFANIMEDSFEGKRTLDQLQKMGSTYGRSAAGSEVLKSNINKIGGKVTTPKLNDAATRSKVADIVDNKIGSALDDAEPGVVENLKAGFRKDKQDYQQLARGKEEAVRTLTRADATPLASKAEMVGLGYALMNPFSSKAVLAGLGLGKIQQAMTRFPRVGTGLGMAVKNATNTSAWDVLMYQNAIKAAKEDNKDRPYP